MRKREKKGRQRKMSSKKKDDYDWNAWIGEKWFRSKTKRDNERKAKRDEQKQVKETEK